MKRLYPMLTVVAGFGYLTSLVLYGLTFFDINAKAMAIYSPLTFVLYGTMLLAVLKLVTNPEIKALQGKKQRNPLPLLQLMFKSTPAWLRIVAGVSFVGAMISFMVLMDQQPGVVSIMDGKPVLHDHGTIMKELTDEEYQHALAVEARMFLGHYIAFLGIATALLYPEKQGSNNGH